MILLPPTQDWLDHRIREDEGQPIEAGLTIARPPTPVSASASAEAAALWQDARIELAIQAHARAAEMERQFLIALPKCQSPSRRLAAVACARSQLAARQYGKARQTVADSLVECSEPETVAALHQVRHAAIVGSEFVSYHDLQIARSDQETTHGLHRIVAQALERFHATSAILFEPHENVFRPLLVRQNALESNTLHREDASIVTHVARTRQSYCAEPSQSRQVPFGPSTRDAASEVAIPLVDSRDGLLAVLYLASTVPAAFSPAQMGRLEELTSGLIPFLLLRQANCGWHFLRHGWDLHRFLDDLCANVCDVLRTHGSRIACLVWRRDPAKGEIYLAGTDGYDSEYKTQPLRPGSFTAAATDLPHGKVRSGPWKDFPEFSRPDKAERMGIRRISSTPIYLPGSRTSTGAVSLYYFGDCPTMPDSILVHLADIVARELALYDAFRAQVADAWCHAKLAQRALDSLTAFELIKQSLLECLSAPACSLFAKLKDTPRLGLVSTTGLEEGDRPVTDLESVHYDLDAERGGLTWHLGRTPGLCIRRNDVLNSDESGLGQSVRAQNRYREQFGLGPTDHRRFLGISVTDDATTEVLGVIRLNRPTDAPPFTAGDEEVLRTVATNAVRAYRDWRNEESRKTIPTCGLDHLRRRAALEAHGSLLRPLPTYNRSISGLCQKVLHDILDLSRSLGAFQASVRELISTDDGCEELRILAFASTLHGGGASETHERRGPGTPADSDSVAWHCLDMNKVLTFDRNRCPQLVKPIDRQAVEVVCGANLPLLASRAGRRIRGVFAIDFTHPVRWNSSTIWGLFQACTKMCTIFSDSSPVDFAEPTQVLSNFVDATREILGADWIGLELLNDQSRTFEPILSLGRRIPALTEAWRPPQGPGQAYGVRSHQNVPNALHIPLLSGPFESARLRLGLHGDPASPGRLSGIPAVVGLWSNIAFELSSGSPMLNGQFYSKSHPEHDGIAVWHEHIGWAVPTVVTAADSDDSRLPRFRLRPTPPKPLN